MALKRPANLKVSRPKGAKAELRVPNQYADLRQMVDESLAVVDEILENGLDNVNSPEKLQLLQNDVKQTLKELAQLQLSCGFLWKSINDKRVAVLKSQPAKAPVERTVEELNRDLAALKARIDAKLASEVQPTAAPADPQQLSALE